MSTIIGVFDTTVGSYNIGNNIIMKAVYEQLKEIFPLSQFYKLPPMDIGKYTRSCIRKSDITFFGGTNSLNNNFYSYRQWDLNLRNTFSVRDIILLGVGWWQYESGPVTTYSQFLLRKVLAKNFLHSVRDEYTKNKLSSIGIKSINTGCPTIWKIDQNILDKIPARKPANVVFTITDYNKNIERDKYFLEVLNKNYEQLFCFPQGVGDVDYLKGLRTKTQITFLKPDLQEFDEILLSGTVDYIGTRLHAGIRAIQKSVYSIIIGIDNRATEMGADFNLPVIPALGLNDLQKTVTERPTIQLRVPYESIAIWKNQFK